MVLNIDESRKTTENLKLRKAFASLIGNKKVMAEADCFGIASGYGADEKLERNGMHAVKSEYVAG